MQTPPTTPSIILTFNVNVRESARRGILPAHPTFSIPLPDLKPLWDKPDLTEELSSRLYESNSQWHLNLGQAHPGRRIPESSLTGIEEALRLDMAEVIANAKAEEEKNATHEAEYAAKRAEFLVKVAANPLLALYSINSDCNLVVNLDLKDVESAAQRLSQFNSPAHHCCPSWRVGYYEGNAKPSPELETQVTNLAAQINRRVDELRLAAKAEAEAKAAARIAALTPHMTPEEAEMHQRSMLDLSTIEKRLDKTAMEALGQMIAPPAVKLVQTDADHPVTGPVSKVQFRTLRTIEKRLGRECTLQTDGTVRTSTVTADGRKIGVDITLAES